MAKAAFGVDFGTTNTTLTFIGDLGDTRCKTLPSVLNLHTKSIGTLHDPPETSIMHFKLAVGHTHSRAKEQGVLDKLHYVSISDNKNCITVKGSEGKDFSVAQCIAMYVKLAVDETRTEAGGFYKDCNRCSITFPATFFSIDIEAIIYAFQVAGLEVVSAVSEPVAAAVHQLTAVDSPVDLKEGTLILTFDMGGGTMDLTVMRKNAKFGDTPRGFTAIATGGDPRLGGTDIDADIVELFKEKAKILSEADQSWIQDAHNSAKLLCAAEDVKKKLSVNSFAIAKLGESFVEVTREELNDACSTTFDKILKVCRDFLESNNVKPEDIGALSLIGGGSQVPEIKAKLRALLPHIQACNIMDRDFDTAVAQGALKIVLTGSAQVIDLTDCTPMEYGVRMLRFRESIDEQYSWIKFGIEAGRKLPVEDAEIEALVPMDPHVHFKLPIYECRNIKEDGNPKSEANSEIGELIILNDNQYEPGSKIKILLSISESRHITVKVEMANGDVCSGGLKKRGDRTLMEKIKDKNDVNDYLLNANTQPSSQAEPSQPDGSISSTEQDDDTPRQPKKPKKTGRKTSEQRLMEANFQNGLVR